MRERLFLVTAIVFFSSLSGGATYFDVYFKKIAWPKKQALIRIYTEQGLQADDLLLSKVAGQDCVLKIIRKSKTQAEEFLVSTERCNFPDDINADATFEMTKTTSSQIEENKNKNSVPMIARPTSTPETRAQEELLNRIYHLKLFPYEFLSGLFNWYRLEFDFRLARRWSLGPTLERNQLEYNTQPYNMYALGGRLNYSFDHDVFTSGFFTSLKSQFVLVKTNIVGLEAASFSGPEISLILAYQWARPSFTTSLGAGFYSYSLASSVTENSVTTKNELYSGTVARLEFSVGISWE